MKRFLGSNVECIPKQVRNKITTKQAELNYGLALNKK